MTPPVTSAAPKAPPAPTSTAPVGAPRIPNATRVAQGRAATVLGGVAGAAVAVDGFKQLMNADNVGQRLEGAGRLMLGAGQFMPGAGPLLKGASRLGSGAALVVDDARTTIDGNRNRSLERERVVNEILARTPRPDGGGEPVGAPNVALPPPLPTGPQRPQLGSAPEPRLAPPPFTRPREFGQAGVIERAAVEAGYGVVGHAWGGDPDAIGGGGARPVYGVTLPGPGDQAGAPGPGPARVSPDIGQSGYGVVGMAYGGDPDAIGGGGERPVYGITLPGAGEAAPMGPDSNAQPRAGSAAVPSQAAAPSAYGAVAGPEPLGPISRAAQRYLYAMPQPQGGGRQHAAPGAAEGYAIPYEQILASLPSPDEFYLRQAMEASEGVLEEEKERRERDLFRARQQVAQDQERVAVDSAAARQVGAANASRSRQRLDELTQLGTGVDADQYL